MKHIIIVFLFSVTVFSQKTTETFASNRLGSTREITIGLPASYEKNPKKYYPLLIVLDSEFLFDPFYGNLNYGAYWNEFPETIIVGINQNKKEERFEDCQYDQLNSLPTKKGALFIEFISDELLPYIEKKYRLASLRIIAGNEITAGHLNFFLYKDNPVFNAYISLSPDLAPEMDVRIPEKLAKSKQHLFYYQSTGAGDLKETIQTVSNLDNNIKQINNPLLHYKYDHVVGASHYASVLHAIPSALYLFFEVYKPISMAEFNEKIVILPNGYVKYLVDKYDEITKALGINVQVKVTDFKAIEAAILKNKAYKELDKLSDIARKNYPKSMLADYELALMYEKTGDYAKAGKAYQKATQSDEIGDLTKEMMMEKYEEMQKTTKKK